MQRSHAEGGRATAVGGRNVGDGAATKQEMMIDTRGQSAAVAAGHWVGLAGGTGRREGVIST
jgi:hypothetical protein